MFIGDTCEAHTGNSCSQSAKHGLISLPAELFEVENRHTGGDSLVRRQPRAHVDHVVNVKAEVAVIDTDISVGDGAYRDGASSSVGASGGVV